MKKNIDPFLYNIHSIDVHGYDRYGSVALIKNFLDNEIKIGSKKVIIIHGKGEGILKEATHNYLIQDKRILEFKLDIFNDGQTIVTLK